MNKLQPPLQKNMSLHYVYKSTNLQVNNFTYVQLQAVNLSIKHNISFLNHNDTLIKP